MQGRGRAKSREKRNEGCKEKKRKGFVHGKGGRGERSTKWGGGRREKKGKSKIEG